MARNRDPFTQALSSLRERITAGVLTGGSPVIVQDEAQRLRLSTTPVREALARLSGEGLVERASSGGYVTVRLDAAAARERYGMRSSYVRIAIDLNSEALGSVRLPRPLPVGDTPGQAVSQLFKALVCSAGSQLLWDSFQKINGQLDLLSRFEGRLFNDLEQEAQFLCDVYERPGDGAFGEAACAYHRRRMSAAGALAAMVLADPSTSVDGPAP